VRENKKNTALSVNLKQRFFVSCKLLINGNDREGSPLGDRGKLQAEDARAPLIS